MSDKKWDLTKLRELFKHSQMKESGGGKYLEGKITGDVSSTGSLQYRDKILNSWVSQAPAKYKSLFKGLNKNQVRQKFNELERSGDVEFEENNLRFAKKTFLDPLLKKIDKNRSEKNKVSNWGTKALGKLVSASIQHNPKSTATTWRNAKISPTDTKYEAMSKLSNRFFNTIEMDFKTILANKRATESPEKVKKFIKAMQNRALDLKLQEEQKEPINFIPEPVKKPLPLPMKRDEWGLLPGQTDFLDDETTSMAPSELEQRNKENENKSYDKLSFRDAFNQAWKDKKEGATFMWKGNPILLKKA